jgi:type II restriction/modification system DNA methylase subunit YeeA
VDRKPILTTLDTIECRDALLEAEGEWEASWPDAEFIVGNPPFLGNKRIITGLGASYTERLRATYKDRVPASADLVMYWFEKARAAVVSRRISCVGLVATNSIRGGANRKVLEKISETLRITDAWPDEEWVIDGAAVRVSLVVFSRMGSAQCYFAGQSVNAINSDLTAMTGSSNDSDLTIARRLSENVGISFQGPVLVGPFDVDGDLARSWLVAPLNPNGRANTDVLRPLSNGMDITRRSRGRWVIDFGRLSRESAALFEKPFESVKTTVRPVRESNAEEWRRSHWWLHGRTGDEFRTAVHSLKRYIATSQVSKHRNFVFLSTRVFPHQTVIAIARDDDTTFGILHSRFHELWALRMGTSLEDRPRYTPSTTFETFAFPEGLTPNIPAEKYKDDPRAKAIAAAAARLNELREAWLNPEDLVRREPEVVPGFPDRILPRTEKAAAELKKRTLTNLYNTKPQWLVDAHAALDRAVAAAYGWPSDLTDDEILARLLALNLERAKTQAAPIAAVAAEGDEPVATAAKRRRKRKHTEE